MQERRRIFVNLDPAEPHPAVVPSAGALGKKSGLPSRIFATSVIARTLAQPMSSAQSQAKHPLPYEPECRLKRFATYL
jgi:hypothetical protein